MAGLTYDQQHSESSNLSCSSPCQYERVYYIHTQTSCSLSVKLNILCPALTIYIHFFFVWLVDLFVCFFITYVLFISDWLIRSELATINENAT